MAPNRSSKASTKGRRAITVLGTLDFLKYLNQEQRVAVEWGEGPLLVLAGAGSGKTRVLVSRIAYLIETGLCTPDQVLAVTFTNKAAAEMRRRVAELLAHRAGSLQGMVVSTFHSSCVQFLRSDIHRLGRSSHFTIYDDADQLSVIKAAMKELNLSETVYSPKRILGRIEAVKNEGLALPEYQPAYGGPFEDAFIRVFESYESTLKASSAVDFSDLILLMVKLLESNAELRAAYQERFRYILIDEYQDTNKCQYKLVKLLAGSSGNLFAVGDEDQSIYRWRGADIGNILSFERDYPTASVLKLEQNYRSTRTIIEAASFVIANNTERRDKKLWTENDPGSVIQIQECYDGQDEAIKVVQEVRELEKQGISLGEIAIFYRTNAQSRLLEDALRAQGIGYQIYGGTRFYDRLEVKDALAYLRLLANPDDDVSFRRILNVPARGLGAVTVEKIVTQARNHHLSHYGLLQAAFRSATHLSVDFGRGGKGVRKFFDLIESLSLRKSHLLPSDLLAAVLEESGYRASLSSDPSPEARSRLENLYELRQSLVEYELRWGAENPNAPITLERFLEDIALISDSQQVDRGEALRMMTIHMAKGLEFDAVLMVGLEEELFPNLRAEDFTPSELEEERRLFYVGMTRARKELRLYYAKNRTVFGLNHFRVVSRFVDEIPPHFCRRMASDFFVRRAQYRDRPVAPSRYEEDFSQVNPLDDENQDPEASAFLRRGSSVRHPVFGPGRVVQKVGDAWLIDFQNGGRKRISIQFAGWLEPD